MGRLPCLSLCLLIFVSGLRPRLLRAAPSGRWRRGSGFGHQRGALGTEGAGRSRSCTAEFGGPGRPVVIGAVADWVRDRLKAKPDLTMRALSAELDARGTPASHDTVWRFVRAEGLTVKKDADRERAGGAGGRALPGALEGAPAPGRPRAADLRGRDLDQNQHGPGPGLEPARHPAARQGAARPCVDAPSGARKIFERVLRVIGCCHVSGL